MTRSAGRGGLTSGDVLLALAGLALVAAIAYPRTERALLWRTVAGTEADVETVRAAAAAHRDETGGWPAPAEAGAVPAELARRLPPGFSFQAGSYTLEWSRWEIVDPAEPADPERVVQPPPGAFEPVLPPTAAPVADVEVPVETLGAVTVHARDERVLAALLERFGASRSFIRERSWTLVLPPGGGG
ncbi:MAG: hypothetical protein ACYC6F_16385 [Longimicrobiales bacterium]